MAVVANKKSAMTLYTSANDVYSHRTRIVMAEKVLNFICVEVDPKNPPEELLEVNPYGSTPTLVDRNLVLYHSRIIMEYLDERFPHPPLLPVYPVARAQFRLMMHRIEKDWYSLVDIIYKGTEKKAEKARTELLESLMSVTALFKQTPYLMSEDFSVLDCSVAPVLWRLPELGIELPKTAKVIESYAERMFERKSFQQSLTETEREIRLELSEYV